MSMETQHRPIRPTAEPPLRGEVLVVEDSFDDRQPPLADNAATRAFGHLGEESKHAALA
jgi:hypothetical protein